MPVRLVKPYGGQAANTLYWENDQATLRAVGIADDNIELASDYALGGDRLVTSSTATVSRNAHTYRMNSASAQTLTLNRTGYLPKDSVISVIQEGAGATTVVPGSGVTISPKVGASTLVTGGQGAVAQLVKGDGETWRAVGSIG